jgi:hypothetical protein
MKHSSRVALAALLFSTGSVLASCGGSAATFGALAAPTPAATSTPTPSPSQSPSPSPSPAATPAGAIVLSPSSLAFVAAGSANAQTFAASETGYSGAFTESDTCPSIATIAQTSATFTVTPVAAGSCIVTVADSHQQKSTVTISVTTSGAVIQAKGGR